MLFSFPLMNIAPALLFAVFFVIVFCFRLLLFPSAYMDPPSFAVFLLSLLLFMLLLFPLRNIAPPSFVLVACVIVFLFMLLFVPTM